MSFSPHVCTLKVLSISWGKNSQGNYYRRGGEGCLGTISPRKSSRGENFATLEIPKAPSTTCPNDRNKTTRHAPNRESKVATHCHNMVPELQTRLSQPFLAQLHIRSKSHLALLKKHNACSCGVGWNCYDKISRWKIFATFPNSEICPAKFSPRTRSPVRITQEASCTDSCANGQHTPPFQSAVSAATTS